jgi:ECF sigma factor
MRRILVENARRKRGAKHGGGRKRVIRDDAVAYSDEPADELLALDASPKGSKQKMLSCAAKMSELISRFEFF